MRRAFLRFSLFWALITIPVSALATTTADLVSLQLRAVEDPAAATARVIPSEPLPEGHAPAPVPAFGGVVAPSGQAFRLTAALSGPRELTLHYYHNITDTWARVGSTPLPADLLGLQAIPQGFLLSLAGPDGPVPYVVEVVQTKRALPALDWIVIAVYLLGMLGVGWYCYNRERRGANSTEDYFLAGRDVPWWAAGLSLYATGTSAISFIAIPALSFATNWLYLAQQCIGVFGLLFVAYKIIPVVRRLNLTSIYHFLELRFHPSIRLMSSALVILFQLVGRLSVVLYHRLGTLAEMANIFAKGHASVVKLKQTQLDGPFHTYEVELEVHDLAHLTRILSALRASDAVAEAERI